MARRLVSLPSFSAVAAGQTAAIDLPVTDVYHGLRIKYNTTVAGGPTRATAEAHIPQIRVKVNGKVQRRFSLKQLNALNAYHGIPFTAGDATKPAIFPIYFSEPWRRSAQGEDSLGWGMADVETFQVEIDLDAAAAGASLSMVGIKEKGNRPMGPIVKVRNFRVPVSAVGVVNLTTLPKQDAYYALHANSSDIADATVLVDQEEIFRMTGDDANAYYAEQGFTPQSGWFHIDFAATARVADALPMRDTAGNRVRDFRVDYNMTAANSFDLLAEVLGLRD